MKLKCEYTLIWLLITLTGCYSRSDYENNMSLPDSLFTKTIDFHELYPFSVEKTVDISSLGGEIDFVPLETKEGSFFSNAYDLYTNDSLIVINSGGSVLFWDEKGNFLRRFNKSGRGPEEYETIFGFSLDFEADIMAIADNVFIKLYTLNGQFIESLKIPRDPFYLTPNLIFLDSSSLLVESSRFKPEFKEGYSPLWIIDLEEKKFKPFFEHYPNKVESFYKKYNFSGKLSGNKEGVIYSASESYNIYRVQRDAKKPELAYKIDFGIYQMPVGLIHDAMNYLEYRKLFIQLAYIHESKKYLFIRYGINRGIRGSNFEMGYFIFSKKEKKIIANQFESDGINSKKYPGISFWPKYIDEQDQFISLVEASEIKKAEILEGINQQDNPIVIKFKLD